MNPPTYPLPATMTENVEILTNHPVTLSRHRVVVLAYDGLCTFEFGIAVEIFGLPRPEMGERWYQFADYRGARLARDRCPDPGGAG